MKRIVIPIFFCLTVLLNTHSCSEEDAPPSTLSNTSSNRAVRAVSANGYVVYPKSLEKNINATGNLIAYESVEIRPERSGKLVQLNIRESSFVKKGTLLAQIDDAELIAQQNRFDINLDLALKELERGKELLKIQGISQEEIDRLANRVEEIKADKAIVDIQISKSKVHAPFSGKLGLKQISQGAYVTPSDVLIELQQINPIKLEFDIPEKFLSDVKEGQELKFTVVGVDQVFLAKVYAIGTEISPTTRTFKVRANSPNPSNLLKPGQFAKITLVTGVNEKAVLIPTDAVIPVLEGKQVYRYHSGKAEAVKVETGDRKSEDIEIVSGLSLGDTIIVSGLLNLTDGVPVELNELQNPINVTEP